MEKEQNSREEAAHPEHHGDELAALRDFIEKHGMTILVVLCVAIAAVTSMHVYTGRKRGKALRAVSELVGARTIPALESVEGSYGGTPAGRLATLRLAKEHYNAGSYDLALGKYDEFAKGNPDHEFVSVAVVGRLHCLEASGQLEQALEGFANFASANTNHFLTPQVVFARARCLEQLGRLDEARIVLEDFMAAEEDEELQSMVEDLLDNVNRKINQKQAGITTLAVPPALALPPVAPTPIDVPPVMPVPMPAATVSNPAATPVDPPAVAPVPDPAPTPAPVPEKAPVVAPVPVPAPAPVPEKAPVDQPATNKP